MSTNYTYPYPTLPPVIEWQPIGAPGAGNNLSVTIPGDSRFLLYSLRFTLTTDANVASRICRLYSGVLTGQMYGFPANNIQPASTAFVYNFVAGVGDSYTIGVSQETVQPLPSPFYIQEGHLFEILIDNIQVGDALTGIVLTAGRYPERN